ncbi:MAG: DUF996 domain-containing protein [Candidatus Bathyarchaeota archaeon]|nr:DUF996 domain-containing protein [Candidatus Termiticorpusculum sp.]
MNFRTSKNLGCIGALIIALGTIFTGAITLLTGINTYGILGIVGLIAILLSIQSLSNFYQAKNIFTNARMGVVVAIMGSIGLSAFSVVSPISDLWTLFLLLVVIIVFAIIATVFVRRALNELATRSGVGEFASASKLLFIGAILTVILIGVLLMWIAIIGVAIAFFQMKEPKPGTLTDSTTTFCPNCGTHASLDTTFCTHCGNQLKIKN